MRRTTYIHGKKTVEQTGDAGDHDSRVAMWHFRWVQHHMSAINTFDWYTRNYDIHTRYR